MAFNAYQDYLDQQRRQRRWERIIPIFIVAVILLILAIAFHGAYVRSHAKPKPSAAEVTFYDVQSGYEPGHALPGTVWIKCNAGMDVTDLKNCPEYRTNKAYLAYVAAIERKHKRKNHQETQRLCDSSGHCEYMPKFKAPYESFYFISTVPASMWCERMTKTSVMSCDSRPLMPDEIKMYQPKPDMSFEGRFETPHFIQCPTKDCLPDPSAETPPAGYVTTPQDITNLMEQIAPTPKQERKPCPGGCDDGWDAEENAYACVKDGRLQPPSQISCAESGLEPAKWPTIASVQIQLTQKQKDAFPSNAWMKPCGPDNHADGCYVPDPTTKPIVEWHINPPAKPDCRMPADIDVCPQTVDPKGRP